MDRSGPFILSVFNKARKNDLAGYWELILAAINDSTAVRNIARGVSATELCKGAMSELAISPTVVEMRIEALSVCNIELLRVIRDELKDIDKDNPFLHVAKCSLEKIFSPKKVDFDKEPWHWSNHLTALPPDGFLLSQRPMHETKLTTDDLITATSNGGGILRALRYQNVSFENIDYSHWLNTISSIDPWVLALVIEISRKSGIPIKEWRVRYINYFKVITEPCAAIPSIYTLISPDWVVP